MLKNNYDKRDSFLLEYLVLEEMISNFVWREESNV